MYVLTQSTTTNYNSLKHPSLSSITFISSKQDPCQSDSASKMAQGTLDTMVERENVLLAEI